MQAVLEHEVDVLVIDASDGHTAFQHSMLTWLKSRYAIPVIAGNVVTTEGFQFLCDAGADAVKVGMGIGSGCTTQEVKATGRAQATALLDVTAARDQLYDSQGIYVPIIADGGIRGPADMTVALALGADALMMGNLLARCTESQGQVRQNAAGQWVKSTGWKAAGAPEIIDAMHSFTRSFSKKALPVMCRMRARSMTSCQRSCACSRLPWRLRVAIHWPSCMPTPCWSCSRPKPSWIVTSMT